MPAPRYPLEEGATLNGHRRALDGVSLDVDGLDGRATLAEGRLTSLEADQPYDAAGSPAYVNWGGTAPATVKEALDRIAAALGPIP